MTIQQEFAQKCVSILQNDESVIGLAVAGSWLTNEMDEFSDLDLVLVTKQKISQDKSLMIAFAQKLGNFLSGFTGEHVGEPRVLICLYDNPLLHVDIKFLTIEEFVHRIENPVILLDTDGQLQQSNRTNNLSVSLSRLSMARRPFLDLGTLCSPKNRTRRIHRSS